MINSIHIPNSATSTETFFWYRPNSTVSLGIAHLFKQNSFRYLATLKLFNESENYPGVFASAGVQGIGTGNPGYSLVAEKNFQIQSNSLNIFSGIGFRSNENHAHLVGGAKWGLTKNLTIGIQSDGHQYYPFINQSKETSIFGIYLIGGKTPAFQVGIRF